MLIGFVTILVFRAMATDDRTERWATDDPEMSRSERQSVACMAWGIEDFHRGNRCQRRLRKTQWNDIDFGIRAFVRLEYQRFANGTSRSEPSAESTGCDPILRRTAPLPDAG